jgi:hypothetical protein
MPENTPPAEWLALHDMILGKWVAQALSFAAKLGIADSLKDGPKGCDELARMNQMDADALYRVLRALASVGVFAEVADRRFALTPTAGFLRSDAPGSLRAVATMIGEDWTWRPWGDLYGCVKTGEPAFARVFGAPAFEYLARNPIAATVFDEAMTGWSMQNSPPVAAGYDFSGIETLMDVGGGHGLLLATILKANPSLKGVLYETPEVCEGARERFEAEGLADRCRVVPGDFFEAVPEGADACILKSVIHDWDDARAATILRNCARAVGPGGRVLLAEMVIPPGDARHPGKLLDLEMLVLVGGRERTEGQFRELFASAGIRLSRIVPTASPMCVVEGVVEG